MLAIYCWLWGLPFRVVCIPSETPLEEINLSFASGYQSRYDFWVRGGGMYLFLSTLGPHLMQTYAGPVHVCVHMGTSLLYLEDLDSLMSPFWLLQSFCLPFLSSLNPEGRDLVETSHLGSGVPRSLPQCIKDNFLIQYILIMFLLLPQLLSEPPNFPPQPPS